MRTYEIVLRGEVDGHETEITVHVDLLGPEARAVRRVINALTDEATHITPELTMRVADLADQTDRP